MGEELTLFSDEMTPSEGFDDCPLDAIDNAVDSEAEVEEEEEWEELVKEEVEEVMGGESGEDEEGDADDKVL